MADFVNDLLKAWGLETLIPTFQEQEITGKDVFLQISDDLLKEVIPKAGIRYKFLKERAAYLVTEESTAQNENTPPQYINDTDDTLSVTSSAVESEPSCPVTDCDQVQKQEKKSYGQKLRNLLRGSIVGSTLLKQKRLTSYDRKRLCSIIIDHLLGTSSKISSEQFLLWSIEITHVFKFEKEEAYYVPYKGGRHKRLASGKLWDRYANLKRYIKSKLTSTAKESSDIEITEEVKDKLLRLNNISPQDNELKVLWKETSTYRDKTESIIDYYDKYPVLKTPVGLSLIQLDFELMGITPDTLIFQKKWPDIARRILKVAEHQKSCKNIINAIAEIPIENQALLLLPHLFRSSLIKTNTKKQWKPSIQEISQSFILHLMHVGEYELALNKRRDLLLPYGLTIQPFILAVGASVTSTYVVINDVKYECSSLASAVDGCFKAFYALNAEYPREGEMVWNFLQRFVYSITNHAVSDKHYVCVESLWTELSQVDL